MSVSTFDEPIQRQDFYEKNPLRDPSIEGAVYVTETTTKPTTRTTTNPLQNDAKETAKESQSAHSIGPGRIVMESGEIKPDHSVLAHHYVKQLNELPNAFDPVTGKINSENDRAVMLYEMVRMFFINSQFPIYWGYEKQ